MTHTRIHAQPGYPFRLALELEYALTEDGLTRADDGDERRAEPLPVRLRARIPYLTLGTPTVDPLVLSVPARTVLVSDERGIPTGSGPVEGTERDFRSAAADRRDGARSRLHRPRARRRRPRPRRARAPGRCSALTLWVDEAYRYLMVFTGDPLPDVNRRSLAVEPMTCPPNAFRTGEALIRLEPGDSFAGSWGLTPATGS